MDDIRGFISIAISVVCAFIAYRGYTINSEKRKEEVVKTEADRKKEVQSAIDVLREHSEQSLKIQCAKHDSTIEKIENNLFEINQRLTQIETKTNLFWTCIEKNVTSLIKTMPTHPDKDILLTHMAENILTLKEAEVLKEILLHEKDQVENKDKALGYVFVLFSLEQKIDKLRRDGENVEQSMDIPT